MSARLTPFTRGLERRVAASIRKRDVLRDGEAIVVGVSGGPDSTALLVVLSRLCTGFGLTITAAHFDHKLRSRDEAEGDHLFVAKLCRSLGVPLVSGAGDVRRRAKREGESIEEAARNMRYRFLGSQAKSIRAAAVVVGHTLDDRAETVLLHLIRGSGLGGLAAMPPRSAWPFGAGPDIARPLLEISRRDVERYCRDLGIEPRRDPTNDLPIATRNRIRSELMPVLQSFNPKAADALARLADAAAADSAFIDAAAAAEWSRIADVSADRVTFSRASFRSLPPPLAARLLRRAAAHIGAQPEAVHLERVLALSGNRRTQVAVPGGVVVVGADRVVIAREHKAALARSVHERPLVVPGRTRAGEWTIEATHVERDAAQPLDHFAALLDVDAIDGPLIVRSRKRGDRMRPLGLGGSKKLQDIFVDAKVPQEERDSVPVIADRLGIVWVAGHCIDQRVAIAAKTRRVMRLRARRKSSR
jgi:tRNA(Ile)-lysidine synthase